MIQYIKNRSIFDSKCEVITNPINCVGVMGGGLAAAFKKKFPKMFNDYLKLCSSQELIPGRCVLWDDKTSEHKVLLFPTKDHWRFASRYRYVAGGLRYFVAHYKDWGIKSIAFPALGCGLGGLDWEDVKFLMEEELKSVKDELDIEIYIPQ